MKYTSGPWSVAKEHGAVNGYAIVSKSGGIASVYNDKYAKGNAQLIAAAPEMLEALKAAEEFLKILALYHNENDIFGAVPEKVKRELIDCLAIAGSKSSEAIAKTKGDNRS